MGRTRSGVTEQWRHDPIPRFGKILIGSGRATPVEHDDVDVSVKAEIVTAIESAKQALNPARTPTGTTSTPRTIEAGCARCSVASRTLWLRVRAQYILVSRSSQGPARLVYLFDRLLKDPPNLSVAGLGLMRCQRVKPRDPTLESCHEVVGDRAIPWPFAPTSRYTGDA